MKGRVGRKRGVEDGVDGRREWRGGREGTEEGEVENGVDGRGGIK